MKQVLSLLLVIFLMGCGGGGTSSSVPSLTPTPSPTPAPKGPEPERKPALVPPGSNNEFIDYIKMGLAHSYNRSAPIPLPMPSSEAGMVPNGEVSDTNVLVEGVDEADIAKFDGEYLYLANQDRVQIFQLYDEKPAELISTSRMGGGGEVPKGMYHLAENSLLANIRSGHVPELIDYSNPLVWTGQTYVDLLDVTDPTALVVMTQLRLDGHYVNSRRVGDQLYLISRYTPSVPGLVPFAETDEDKAANQSLIEAVDIDDILPNVRNSRGAEEPLVSTDQCFLPRADKEEDQLYSPIVTTITAINLNDPSQIRSICMAAEIQGLHMSQEALYLAAYGSGFNEVRGSFEETEIHKIGLTEVGPVYRGSASIRGHFWGDPAFLMGEHEGNLTAITTSSSVDLTHRLTVLTEGNDFTLEVVSELPNEARPESIGKPGEQIFASRITGDRAFVVTFERIDPVYVIDLANPADPFIAGELEIPGFSSYLHPVNEDLLLGIGKDVLINEEGFALQQGANVRLFDVSNPTNPLMLEEIKIGQRGTESPVLWNPHAFTSLEKDDLHRIAIPFRVADGSQVPAEDWDYYPWQRNALMLFEVDPSQRSLVQTGELVAEDHTTGERFQPHCCAWSERSFINGDRLHFLSKTRLFSATWRNPGEAVNVFVPTVFVNPEEEVSTTDMRPGILGSLYDSLTGEYLGCGNLTASEDDYVDQFTGCVDRGGVLERPGRYSLEAEFAAYLNRIVSDVVVQADQHHVQPVYVNLYLEPKP